MKRVILAVVLGLFGAVNVQAANYTAGKDYIEYASARPTADKNSVEIKEFFSYACPHCFRFRPHVDEWLEKEDKPVKLIRVPVVFHPTWEPLAKAYYTAEVLGVEEKTHAALFDEIHTKRTIKIRGGNIVEQLASFFEKHGVAKDQFLNTYNSFVVDGKVRKGKTELRNYKIGSTPTVIVNGKYLVNSAQAKTHQGMILVMDYLVDQEAPQAKQ